MTIQKFENVRNIRINGKKYSCCDWYEYHGDKNAWVYNGELLCKNWYKRGETIFKKYQDERNG